LTSRWCRPACPTPGGAGFRVLLLWPRSGPRSGPTVLGCSERGGLFAPLAAECFGCLARQFAEFLQRAGTVLTLAAWRRARGSQRRTGAAHDASFVPGLCSAAAARQARSSGAVMGVAAPDDPTRRRISWSSRRLWEQAPWEGAPTLDDTALVAPLAD
jgi:hypothetical protein